MKNVHERINELVRQARRLAPVVTDDALETGCTTMAQYTDKYGPRQQKAYALVQEAHRLNAISEDDAALSAEGLTR